MDMTEVLSRVEAIRDKAHDDEAAHGMEDDLMRDFIGHVAESNLGELSEMAVEVLRTGSIEFSRWCA